MSKSLGNFFTLRDLLAKGFTGREIRYALIQAHYRESFNFTMDGLQGARQSLARLDECFGKVRGIVGSPKSKVQSPKLEDPVERQFAASLDDDLNISGAWGAIFEWVRELNKLFAENSVDATKAASALAAWEKIDSVLGVGVVSDVEVPPEINSLLEQRQAARKAKDFKRADAIRDELKNKGWVIEDTPKGARAKRV